MLLSSSNRFIQKIHTNKKYYVAKIYTIKFFEVSIIKMDKIAYCSYMAVLKRSITESPVATTVECNSLSSRLTAHRKHEKT